MFTIMTVRRNLKPKVDESWKTIKNVRRYHFHSPSRTTLQRADRNRIHKCCCVSVVHVSFNEPHSITPQYSRAVCRFTHYLRFEFDTNARYVLIMVTVCAMRYISYIGLFDYTRLQFIRKVKMQRMYTASITVYVHLIKKYF